MATTIIDQHAADVRRHAAAAGAVQDKLDAGEPVTEADIAGAEAHVKAGLDAARRLKQARADDATRAALRDLTDGLGLLDGYGTATTHPKVKALGGSTWADSVIRRHADPMGHYKALLPSGAVPITVPVQPEPVRATEPILALRQLIPTIADSVGRWSFLRQTVRTSNAAVVAPGARKPTSVFSLERIEGRAVTIAHLSEPLNRADLDDAPALREFVDVELRLGLAGPSPLI